MKHVMRVSLAARLVREIRGFLRTRPAEVNWTGGAVSFSFDDFPRSAWTNGGRILENRGCRGTYYAAMGMAGTANHLGPMFEPGDLPAAHARGHEIACHTFNHRDCNKASPAEIADEVDANAAALSRVLGGAPVENFAYPFGGVSLTAKSLLGGRFASCRGTGRGLNQGSVDLADLFAISIYSHTFDRARLCQLIDDAQAAGGWLIFYTHDVAEEPSPFGCTPAQLDTIVAYAVEKASVLPVRDVLTGLRLGREQPSRQLLSA
jgi:peptidoglycan/xylan/chitin deacetylase (PgdA/CDA1 family)